MVRPTMPPATERRRTGRRAAVLVAAGLLLCAPLRAAATDEDLQLWLPITLSASFGDSFLGWYEAQPRIGDDVSEATQLILRTALGYRLAPAWSVWFGYAWTPTFQPRYQDENRIYQQLLYGSDFSFAHVSSRTRFEQRWIEGVSGTALRLRSLLRGQRPLGSEGIWSLIVQDEIFFNLNTPASTGPEAGFDQNRFFAGVGRKINPHVSIEAGYQMQFIDSRTPADNRINHILLIQLSLRN